MKPSVMGIVASTGLAGFAAVGMAQKQGASVMIARTQASVEVESVVYDWEVSDGGATPLWCYGNTCIVRMDGDVFASGIDTARRTKTAGDARFGEALLRWTLYKLVDGAWQLQQADDGLTREPCPLGCFQGGPLFLSHSPAARGFRPEVLQFDANAAGLPPTTLRPWGDRQFDSSTYRTFTIDSGNRELLLFHNVGDTHAEWAFLDKSGRWSARGQLRWPRGEDPATAPYGMKFARANYPTVMLKNRAVHFAGAAAWNVWSRVGPDRKELMGRRFGNRWRRLFYTWTPDVTSKPFGEWIELGSTHETGGWLFPGDIWVDDDGVAHVAWFEAPVNEELRQQHFPELKLVYALKYARVKEGRVILRKTLLEGGEGISPEIPGYTVSEDTLVKLPSSSEKDGFIQQRIAGRGQPRFHVTSEGRLFAVYFVGGKDADGNELAENRIMEILPDGTTGPQISMPLRYPMVEFFLATPRGGSRPSSVIDMLGYRHDTLMRKICYARVRLEAGPNQDAHDQGK